MLGNVLRRKEGILHNKKYVLYRRKMGYFPKGLTHDWSRNDDWGRAREKTRLSRLQKYLFRIVKKIGYFPKGLTHDFDQKFDLFFC